MVWAGKALATGFQKEGMSVSLGPLPPVFGMAVGGYAAVLLGTGRHTIIMQSVGATGHASARCACVFLGLRVRGAALWGW